MHILPICLMCSLQNNIINLRAYEFTLQIIYMIEQTIRLLPLGY